MLEAAEAVGTLVAGEALQTQESLQMVETRRTTGTPAESAEA